MNLNTVVFFLIFLGFIPLSYGQILDSGNKSLPLLVPKEKQPEFEKPDSDYLKLPTTTKNEDNPFMKEPEKSIEFTTKSKYVRRKVDFNPNYKEIKDHQLEEYKATKGDQFFGDFNNNGEFLTIYCRDHQAIDGDRVSILVNDKVEIHDVFLIGQFRGFNIQLKPGFNKIEFLALNQGESGPNTAEFQIWDDKGNLLKSEQWNLATGYKAKFVVIKENVPAKEE